MRLTLCLASLVWVAACNADDIDPPTDAAIIDTQVTDPDAPLLADAAIDAPSGTFALTSTAIVEGGVIADLYSCQGTNVSPPLAWTDVGAASYAVVLTDRNNSLVHAIIYDIPGAVTSLPENVMKVAQPPLPAGATQPLAYDNQTRGYLGPCPGSVHTYQFAVFAIDVANLPGLTVNSTRTQVVAAIPAHQTATATLTATFTP